MASLHFYLGLFSTADSVSPVFFSSSPPSPPVLPRFSPCNLLPISPSVNEVSSVAPLIWGDWAVDSEATPLCVSSPAVEHLGTDLGSPAGWEAAWNLSVVLPEALEEACLVSEENDELFNCPGVLGVSARAFWGTEEELFDFRMFLALVPPVSDPPSLDARERGVVAGAVFVVDPVFFGWVDLSEKKPEQKRMRKREG